LGKKISNPKHSFLIFGTKILYKKCALEMLMKLMAAKQANQACSTYQSTSIPSANFVCQQKSLTVMVSSL